MKLGSLTPLMSCSAPTDCTRSARIFGRLLISLVSLLILLQLVRRLINFIVNPTNAIEMMKKRWKKNWEKIITIKGMS